MITNSKNGTTMDKKAYIKPTAKTIILTAIVTAGPIVSQQYDNGPHMPLGTDDGDDNFMSRENHWYDDDEDEE